MNDKVHHGRQPHMVRALSENRSWTDLLTDSDTWPLRLQAVASKATRRKTTKNKLKIIYSPSLQSIHRNSKTWTPRALRTSATDTVNWTTNNDTVNRTTNNDTVNRTTNNDTVNRTTNNDTVNQTSNNNTVNRTTNNDTVNRTTNNDTEQADNACPGGMRQIRIDHQHRGRKRRQDTGQTGLETTTQRQANKTGTTIACLPRVHMHACTHKN